MAAIQTNAGRTRAGSGIYPSRLTRETIASYPTYPEAQRAVDFLSDEKIPRGAHSPSWPKGCALSSR